MLVLARKEGESVIIDNRIKLVFLEYRGDNIRLGFEAPPTVSVHREEIWVRLNGKEWVREEQCV